MSISQTLAPHLPYLRRYARALTGSQASGDAYVAATLEALVKEHKEKASQHSVHSEQIESLTRKNQVHEEEAEQTERQLKETYEKYANPLRSDRHI